MLGKTKEELYGCQRGHEGSWFERRGGHMWGYVETWRWFAVATSKGEKLKGKEEAVSGWMFVDFIFIEQIRHTKKANKNQKQSLDFVMGSIPWSSRIQTGLIQWDGLVFPAPASVWFSRGLTFSSPAAAFSGARRTPLFCPAGKITLGELSSWR